jgi:hypothetical protein
MEIEILNNSRHNLPKYTTDASAGMDKSIKFRGNRQRRKGVWTYWE